MAFFMIDKALNLAQISITLLLVFLNYCDINTSGRGIGGLIFLTFPQMRVLFFGSTQGLAKLTWLTSLATTTTILINSRNLGGFLNSGVFLILRLFFYWPMAMKIVRITFSVIKEVCQFILVLASTTHSMAFC